MHTFLCQSMQFYASLWDLILNFMRVNAVWFYAVPISMQFDSVWFQILCGSKFYVVLNSMWFQIICGSKFYEVSNSMCSKFYVVPNYMWFQVLCGSKFYLVPNSMLFPILCGFNLMSLPILWGSMWFYIELNWFQPCNPIAPHGNSIWFYVMWV